MQIKRDQDNFPFQPDKLKNLNKKLKEEVDQKIVVTHPWAIKSEHMYNVFYLVYFKIRQE